ncbi:MAG: Hsp20/alpha crystallin family protein [Nitrosopumilus sp.]|nr:Hsp20/alpha crystallin family protein [Nitrosopumilus sp.]
MNVPGIKKNEIKINVTDNSLEISAEHRVFRGGEKELS